VVCGLFLTVWDIYGTTFKDILPPVKSLRTGRLKKPETLDDQPSSGPSADAS
jgi:hypothetical protein